MEKNHSQRFSRLRLLLKESGLLRLGSAHVLVLGVGGVGSACAEALARGGVGSLSIIDGDVVELSNINRQALAFTSTLGMDKVDAMTRMIHEINPGCRVYARKRLLTPDGMEAELSIFPRPDYVIDCIDTVSAKLSASCWCAKMGIPMLSAMGAANKLEPEKLRFADISQTVNCRLSRVMRRACRQRGIFDLEVIFSEEPPMTIEHGSNPTKGELLGSMSYMPPIMGQMLAGKVIRRLAGLESGAHPPRLICRSGEVRMG